MKDKKYLILIMIIIGLVLTNVGTVAYYMRTINGTIKGNTGAFTFDVLHNGNTITTINLYETMENPSLTEEYIIPGDSGKFDLLVTAEGSLPGVEYSIDFVGANIPTNMKFYLDEAKTKALKLEYGILGYFKPEDQTKQKTYTIYWDWPYDSGRYNEYDIDYQNKEITIDVTITGKQSDGYAMMKNGYAYVAGGDENRAEGMWNKAYSPKVLSINFSTDLSNMPSECTEANLCWDISAESSRYPVYHYLTANTEDSSKYDAYIVSEKEIYAPVDSSNLFSLVTKESFEIADGIYQTITKTTGKVQSINFNNAFNTSKVKNMFGMFKESEELTSVNLSNFNTSNVTNMNSIFMNCQSLTSLDLSSFNTSKVTNMVGMFMNCSSLTSLDVSSFNTSNVTRMNSMFLNCKKLTSLNLSSFNTLEVTDMSMMFFACGLLTSLDLSNFNTSKVINMGWMFRGCSSLTSLNLSNYNTSNVTDISYMFDGCSKLTTAINIMNAEVTSYSSMFTDAATAEGAQITVNYIADASALVDNMIATKSETSNVVKGSQIN